MVHIENVMKPICSKKNCVPEPYMYLYYVASSGPRSHPRKFRFRVGMYLSCMISGNVSYRNRVTNIHTSIYSILMDFYIYNS